MFLFVVDKTTAIRPCNKVNWLPAIKLRFSSWAKLRSLMGQSHEIFTEGFSYRLTQFRNFATTKEIFEISVTPRTNMWQVSLTLTWYQTPKISLNFSYENGGENYLWKNSLKFKILRHWPFRAGHEKGRLLQENEKIRKINSEKVRDCSSQTRIWSR